MERDNVISRLRMNIRLDKYVSELLYDYDCVIIPRLGGIVTNYKPARFDRGMAYPPTKELGFNKNLTKNDGLLTQSISEVEGVSVREADDFVHQTVERYLEELSGGRRVELRKVGVLYIDDHKNLRFEPDASVNYLRDSFGFEVFKLPEYKEEQVLQVMPKGSEEGRIRVLRSPDHTRGIYRVAAATLAPFIAMSLYLALSTDFKSPTEISPAEIFPLKGKEKKAYSMRDEPDTPADRTPDKTAFPENESLFRFDFLKNEIRSDGVLVDIREAAPEKPLPPLREAGPYHIIGGCFGEKKNAENFVGRLKNRGYQSGVLDLHKGLYRVRIESYADYDRALDELKAMREDGTFPNAWLLKKKVQTNG